MIFTAEILFPRKRLQSGRQNRSPEKAGTGLSAECRDGRLRMRGYFPGERRSLCRLSRQGKCRMIQDVRQRKDRFRMLRHCLPKALCAGSVCRNGAA